MKHYHKRFSVEASNPTAQVKELLAKIVGYNSLS